MSNNQGCSPEDSRLRREGKSGTELAFADADL